MTPEKLNQAIQYLQPILNLKIQVSEDTYKRFRIANDLVILDFEIEIDIEEGFDTYRIFAFLYDFTNDDDDEYVNFVEAKLNAALEQKSFFEYTEIRESGRVYHLRCELSDLEITFERLNNAISNMIDFIVIEKTA